MALSRVVSLEQEVVAERKTSQAHVDEAKQMKVVIKIILLSLSCLLNSTNRLLWNPLKVNSQSFIVVMTTI